MPAVEYSSNLARWVPARMAPDIALIILVILFFATAASGTWHAITVQHRVVVVPFEGPDGAEKATGV